MEDFTATSEGTASPSPTDVGATGASGADATQGQQTAEPSITQTQTAPEPGQEEFSAGWDFDEQGEQQSGIPESDDDIEGLTADPNLDQKQVPKLVEDLRGARAEARQNARELKQYREQIATLEQFGGIEGVAQTMGIVNGLIHNPTEGVVPFLQALAEKATPAYWEMLNTFVEYEADNIVAALQKAGKLPETQQQTSAGQLTAEDWQRIPKELHEIAKQVPANQLFEWLDKGTDESLIYNLKREEKLNQLDSAQRQQSENAWREQVRQAETQASQSIEKLSSRYEQLHMVQLSKWQPFGPQAQEQNQRLYKAVLQGAFAELLSDQKWAELHQDTHGKLQQAPLRRLRNEHLAADADERSAKEAAARFNTKLGQVMKDMINHPVHGLNSVFRDARQWREHQRQSAPERKEIPGINNTASNGHDDGVQVLDENFNITDGYMTKLKEKMKGWRG